MEQNQEHFPVRLGLRIDWAEQDLFGHVNNVMFMKYIQAARVNYWEQIGLYQYFRETNMGPMLVHVHCDYKKPLHYPGNMTILSRMKFIKNTSFSIQHRILDHEGAVSAEAEDVIVMYDFNKNEKILFPNEFRKKVEELEGKKFESA